ncbi:MAG: gas vesicle protein GvpJ [Candidatus Rokuibacteriota bacterium]
MVVERQPGSSSYADAFDRALDKGIVLDADARMSATGIDVRSSGGLVVTVYSVVTISDPDDPR